MAGTRPRAHCACGSLATFGPSGAQPDACEAHKDEGAEPRVRMRGCKCACGVRASHGDATTRIPSACTEHKGALVLVNGVRWCKQRGCPRTASFGAERGVPLTCAEHGKSHSYVDVVNNTCTECRVRQPKYGPLVGAPCCVARATARRALSWGSWTC
jgi:hypothetical protein